MERTIQGRYAATAWSMRKFFRTGRRLGYRLGRSALRNLHWWLPPVVIVLDIWLAYHNVRFANKLLEHGLVWGR